MWNLWSQSIKITLECWIYHEPGAWKYTHLTETQKYKNTCRQMITFVSASNREAARYVCKNNRWESDCFFHVEPCLRLPRYLFIYQTEPIIMSSIIIEPFQQMDYKSCISTCRFQFFSMLFSSFSPQISEFDLYNR